jgi:concanavalin A-like lectin/glucanase superfamily protein/VanZ like protein
VNFLAIEAESGRAQLHVFSVREARACWENAGPDDRPASRPLTQSAAPISCDPWLWTQKSRSDHMVSNSNRSMSWIALRVPVITMVLAATAIPIELRSPRHVPLGFDIQASDVVANIAGYVPVGIVLGALGPLRAVIAAALMTAVVEAGQFVMMHRDPSMIDVASNVIGAILGTAISARWGIGSLGLRINRWRALVAATLAVMILFGVWASSGEALNARGVTSPGTLEAYWKLDEGGGRYAFDSSGHGLAGSFSREPMRVAGMRGGAVRLDDATEYIDFGHSTAFRIVGSMTISAWINPTSFPVDDAPIVSSHNRNGLGYQLDTTVDRGPRTIGFKLANVCGGLMARYGATPLVVDTWYHVAGVYDAEAQTLDVYLDGGLDNGFLLGSVTGTQRSSRTALYVGRRSEPEGFEFAGTIDDVRLYSRALTKAEIVADMQGTATDGLAVRPATAARVDGSRGARPSEDLHPLCAAVSDEEDARIPGAAGALGVLVAIACVGLWPSAEPLVYLVISFAAGWLLLPGIASTLPSLDLWMIPLVSLAGGASVAMSVRRQWPPTAR